MAAALSGSKTITASQASAPFLVAPSDSTSTPARQVSSAGVAPVAADDIGEARAVHMHAHPRLAGDRRQGGDLVGPVGRPRLRRLAERQRAGLAGLGLAARKARERLGKRRRLDFAVAAGDADDLGPGGEEFRRAALVVDHMRFLVAEHRLPRRRQRGERQRVGGGAGGDEEDRRLALENLAQARLARAP